MKATIEGIDFTGKSPKFGEWFKSWDEFESYVHSHGDILKLFSEDGSHFEVPVGAWIVKTPDGYNVPSVARFIPAKQEHPEVDVEKEIEKEIDRFWCSLFTDFTMERNPNHSPVFIPNPKYTKEGYRIAYALDIDWKDRKDFDGMAFGPEFLRSTARHFAEWGAIHLNARKEE